ncbi:MAG: MauE/DoxX family redox-associated membrane protein [Sphingomonas sp.]
MDAPLLIACMGVAARIGIACLFAVAAAGKLRRPADWEAAVAAYRLLPDALVTPFARILPPLEIAVAAALVAGPGAALAAGAALLLLFAGAMAANLLRGRRAIDCGCDPAARPRPIGWGMVARNVALAAGLLVGLIPAPALPPPMLIAAGGAGLLLCLVGHILSLLASLGAPRPAAAPGVR